jgi:hypothetical protein
MNTKNTYPKDARDKAVVEVLTERSRNGLPTEEKELLLAVKFYADVEITQGILEMFYRGELALCEENGETMLRKTTPEEVAALKQRLIEMKAKKEKAA